MFSSKRYCIKLELLHQQLDALASQRGCEEKMNSSCASGKGLRGSNGIWIQGPTNGHEEKMQQGNGSRESIVEVHSGNPGWAPLYECRSIHPPQLFGLYQSDILPPLTATNHHPCHNWHGALKGQGTALNHDCRRYPSPVLLIRLQKTVDQWLQEAVMHVRN